MESDVVVPQALHHSELGGFREVRVALALHRLLLQAGHPLPERGVHAREDQVPVGADAVGQRQGRTLPIIAALTVLSEVAE